MKSKIFRFKVKFSLVGELEIEASNSVEAEDTVKNMSDRQIQHLSDWSFENMEVDSEPELIEEI